MAYVPHSESDIKKMLDACGLKSIDELFTTIPANLRVGLPSDLPEPFTEEEVLELAKALADENLPVSEGPSFLGAGIYNFYIPAVVKNIISRGEFLTAYTPYQAEASQGTLQAIYEYQSMIAELTGMDVSNASSYDGGTACADALVLIWESLGKKRKKVLVSEGLHPEYREVMSTYNLGLEMDIEIIPLKDGVTDYDLLEKKLTPDVAGMFIQYPNALGIIEDLPRLEALNSKLHTMGGISVAVNYPIALAILKPPGHIGFDVAVGEGQSLGIPVGYGGPLLGYFALKEQYIRKLPGRLVGRTLDVNGKEGFVLNLQAREQHIRREKATSNICSNQALCALAATVYMTYWGKDGLPRMAKEIACRAKAASERLSEIDGVELVFPDKPFFNEFVIRVEDGDDGLSDFLLDLGIIGGFKLSLWDQKYKNCFLISVTDTVHPDQMEDLCEALEMGIEGDFNGGDEE